MTLEEELERSARQLETRGASARTTKPAHHGFVASSSSAFTPTLPASVDWSGGAPTYATPSKYVFSTVDGGTTWLGVMVGSGFA